MDSEHAFLARRLRPFVDAGLVRTVPTPSQIRQGAIEMTPYVVGTDPLTEAGYQKTLLAHSVLRQPLVLLEVGFDHLRTGSALAARHTSLCAHLQLGPEGFIAGAARFDYPSPEAEGSAMPLEFYSLVAFVNYCATAFPRTLDAVSWRLRPRYYAHLATRRFRGASGLGW